MLTSRACLCYLLGCYLPQHPGMRATWQMAAVSERGKEFTQNSRCQDQRLAWANYCRSGTEVWAVILVPPPKSLSSYLVATVGLVAVQHRAWHRSRGIHHPFTDWHWVSEPLESIVDGLPCSWKQLQDLHNTPTHSFIHSTIFSVYHT